MAMKWNGNFSWQNLLSLQRWTSKTSNGRLTNEAIFHWNFVIHCFWNRRKFLTKMKNKVGQQKATNFLIIKNVSVWCNFAKTHLSTSQFRWWSLWFFFCVKTAQIFRFDKTTKEKKKTHIKRTHSNRNECQNQNYNNVGLRQNDLSRWILFKIWIFASLDDVGIWCGLINVIVRKIYTQIQWCICFL